MAESRPIWKVILPGKEYALKSSLRRYSFFITNIRQLAFFPTNLLFDRYAGADQFEIGCIVLTTPTLTVVAHQLLLLYYLNLNYSFYVSRQKIKDSSNASASEPDGFINVAVSAGTRNGLHELKAALGVKSQVEVIAKLVVLGLAIHNATKR